MRYAFLWSNQSDGGQDEGVKDRPCVVVLAVGEGDNPQVIVAPITSEPPDQDDAIPLRPNPRLGLDRPSWILPWELNVFRWVGPDVRPAPRPSGAWWRIGALAPAPRTALAEAIEARLRLRAARLTPRTT